MAEEVEMTPVAGGEPPKASALGVPVATKPATLKLKPMIRKPMPGAGATATLKPGLKLPPKVGATASLKPGLKLPPKVGATASLKPGLKLPTAAGATGAFKPGLKLPPKPVIRKPGSTVVATPLPKPIVHKPVTPPVATAPTVEAKPVAAPAPEAKLEPVAPEVKPVAAPAPEAKLEPVTPEVKLEPVAEAKPEPVAEVKPEPVAEVKPEALPELPKPLEALKSVTQKLKGVTQEIPQQAILRKTGIIAEGTMSEAQKEAAKHKTARISLSDAMGVAPVKDENAPMKTIRIKRPIDIPGATKPLTPLAKPGAAEVKSEADTKVATPSTATTSITQRKTLKIARPGGAVRPSGKFGIKRPTVATSPSAAPTVAKADGANAAAGEAVPEIADIPDIPAVAPVADLPAAKPASDGPAWLWVLSSLVQAAACVAMGALAWLLYQNTQIAYF